MRGISVVFRKELYRVFSDKKMVMGLFVMPAVVVIGIYFLMGILVTSMMKDVEEHVHRVCIMNAPTDFREFVERQVESTTDSEKYDLIWGEDKGLLEEKKQEIYQGEWDLIVEFPEDFAENILAYDTKGILPDVCTYYNPSEDYSAEARRSFSKNILEEYRVMLLEQRVGNLDLVQVFTVDRYSDEDQIIENTKKASGKMIGYILPYMVTILLFAGAMSLGIDSFSGEKERGTMAMLLMTPVDRTQVVYGKIFALMLLSGLSSLIYGGAMLISVPAMHFLGDTGIEISFWQVAMSLLLILTISFMYVALISLVATLAKNVKEGSSYISPVYIFVMALGMVSMYSGKNMHVMEYLIPVLGPTLALKNIFTLEITPGGFILAVISNLLVGGLCTLITVKCFNQERIMLNT